MSSVSIKIRALVLIATLLVIGVLIPLDAASQPIPGSQPIEKACKVRLANLYLLAGPEGNYRRLYPLPVGTELDLLGVSEDGTWMQAQISGTTNHGWLRVSLRYMQCTVDWDAVPNVPFTPPETLVRINAVPVPDTDPGNLIGIVYAEGTWDYVTDYDEESDFETEILTFRDEFSLQLLVWDPRAANPMDDGIEYVEFFLSGPDGDPVYYARENTAAYCSFGGGAPCGTIPLVPGARWPDDERLPIQSGWHEAQIIAYSDNLEHGKGEWRFYFNIDLSPSSNSDTGQPVANLIQTGTAGNFSVEAEAYDPRVGTGNSDGIAYVEFYLFDANNVRQHYRKEDFPPYCLFTNADGSSTCNVAQVPAGVYVVYAVVIGDNGSRTDVQQAYDLR